MEIKKVRDLTLINLDEEKIMVIACDSCGSIGMKEGDVLKVPPFFTGRFTVRVPMLEVMCAGAEIVTITDAVCAEMNPTGIEIINGIKKELEEAKINDIVLTGSTEENFPTISTGVGVTVIGIARSSRLKINNAKEGAVIISIGLPKVGDEIDFVKDMDIVGYEDIRKLQAIEGVYEIVPVGSKGIQYEAEVLAKCSNLKLMLMENTQVDIKKSGGPATSVIAAVNKSALKNIEESIKNVNIIGFLG